MQVQPDYTRQLTEIARALSRPTTPSWLVFLLGAVSTLLVQLAYRQISRQIEEWEGRRRMRRRLYADVAHLFFAVRPFLALGEPLAPGVYRRVSAELSASFGTQFPGEKYIGDHLEVYISELQAIQDVYARFHAIGQDPNHIALDSQGARWMVGFYLDQGTLQEKYFRKYARPHQGDRLVSLALNGYRESIEDEKKRQESMSSGPERPEG